MSSIRQILVPTDFSEPADQALAYAQRLAQALDATVSLAHVFDDPYDHTLSSEQYVPMPAEIRDEILANIRGRLAERATRSQPNMISHILMGPTAQAIVDCARDQHADLIVMGTNGRHGVAHLLLGSVAERVVRIAPCPVLTVRGAGTERGTKAA